MVVLDSGASRCIFRRSAVFKHYRSVKSMFVYTASGSPIPVLGCGSVGGIPDCMQVPQLERDLLSVPHMDAALGWQTELGGGVGEISDRSGKVMFRDVLDRNLMLYMVKLSDIIGEEFNEEQPYAQPQT